MLRDDRIRRTSGEAGFSFVEATLASVMVLILAWLVSSLALTGMRTQKHNERMARVMEITQDVADDMRRGLTSSMRVFGADAVGLAYRDLLAMPTELPPPLAGSRLPQVMANGRLELETVAEPRTGNDLIYARYAWTADYEAPTTGERHRIDVYRIERYYLTVAGPGPRVGTPDGLNLVQWVSEPMADGTQIDGITDPVEQAEILDQLRRGAVDVNGVTHQTMDVVWLIGDPPAEATTLRLIEPGGTLSNDSSAPRSSTWEILADFRICRRDILDFRHHSIATVFAPPVMGVGRFGRVDTSGVGWPHGFEVQIVGPSSARQALLHLTAVSTRRSDHRAYYDLQVIVDLRDM